MDLPRALRIPPGTPIDLAAADPAETHGYDEASADAVRDDDARRIGDLARALWADGRHALLVILQGTDTSGKDGAIRRVFRDVDPQGMRVVSFKAPTPNELAHDYLWRIHAQAPRRGELVIFNRSHYEDVGIVRVQNLARRAVWSRRYDQINAFERHLAENGTVILKFFLHISKAEQKRRLRARLDDPEKNWKMDLGDLEQRRKWRAYQKAYSEALSRCSTAAAPWHLIPADHKWFRTLAISSIVADRLESLDLRYPKPSFDPRRVRID